MYRVYRSPFWNGWLWVFTSLEILDGLETVAIGISDSAKAFMKLVGPEHVGFINMGIDITPWCDCIPWADVPFVPNIGLYAIVGDPVAIDVACLDAITESVGIPNSVAESKDVIESGIPKMAACGSLVGVSENIQIMSAVKNGLGSKEYNLRNVALQNIAKMKEGGLLPEGGFAGLSLRRLYKVKHPLPDKKAKDGGFKRNPNRIDMTEYVER